MEDFKTQIFRITKVLINLLVQRYKIKEYNGDEVVGSFFEDELVRYDPPEFYEIDVIKTRGKGKKKEYLVHYRGWPSVYDEWKKQSEFFYIFILIFVGDPRKYFTFLGPPIQKQCIKNTKLRTD